MFASYSQRQRYYTIIGNYARLERRVKKSKGVDFSNLSFLAMEYLNDYCGYHYQWMGTDAANEAGWALAAFWCRIILHSYDKNAVAPLTARR